MRVNRREWFLAKEPYPRRTQKEAQDQSEYEVEVQQRELPASIVVLFGYEGSPLHHPLLSSVRLRYSMDYFSSRRFGNFPGRERSRWFIVVNTPGY
jgi:hypothetical protein